MQLNKVAAAIMLSIMVVGCGGGGNSDTTTSTQSPDTASVKAGLFMSDAEADTRAKNILALLTFDQKIQFVHGHGMPVFANALMGYGYESVAGALPEGAGYIPGIPELGIPDNNIIDSGSAPNIAGMGATALPAAINIASSWDTTVAEQFGYRVGSEVRSLGYMTGLGGGINLTREPRNGRAFEYMGEDPILAGTLGGARTIGTQSAKVMGTIKHYAMNESESNRFTSNSIVDEQTMRETELLGFEIAIEKSNPSYVMCSYNRVNSVYACENEYLLNTLKKDMGFKGMVQSDWGAQDSVIGSANAGLDEEQPGLHTDESKVTPILNIVFGGLHFGGRLATAIKDGSVPMSRLDDMVFRKLRSMLITGVMDSPPVRGNIDQSAGNIDAYKLASQSIVLLKNNTAVVDNSPVLPLMNMNGKKIAVIGMYADKGVMVGGGSGAAQPYWDNQVTTCPSDPTSMFSSCPGFLGEAPLDKIKQKFPQSNVSFFSGEDTTAAVDAAKDADVAIVFAGQWGGEGFEMPDLSLPSPSNSSYPTYKYDQNELIAAVAAKAKRVVVVLENGNPLKMPWINDVHAVIETWYPGQRGASALADILSGDVNPSGKLPVTFPNDESELPINRPTSLGQYIGGSMMPKFMEPMVKSMIGDDAYNSINDRPYPEKLMQYGYKWYDANNIKPLFYFGHGLSYTTFGYSSMQVSKELDGNLSVEFNIENTGERPGSEVAQVYVSLPNNVPGNAQPPKKFVGWSKVSLQPGETKKVTVNIPKKYISTWDVQSKKWITTKGEYIFHVSDSADLSSQNSLESSIDINS